MQHHETLCLLRTIPLTAVCLFAACDNPQEPKDPQFRLNDGRVGQAAVTLDEGEIAIDATPLSAGGVIISGFGSFSSSSAIVLEPDPGVYVLRYNSNATPSPSIEFEVLADGTIDYDTTLDPVLAGRGSSTLTVNGHPVTVDFTPLSYNGVIHFGQNMTTAVDDFRLLPGPHAARFNTNANPGPQFEYTVLADGTVDYDTTLDPVLAGRGSSTLTVNGHPVTVDSRLEIGSYTLGGIGIFAGGAPQEFQLFVGLQRFISSELTFDFELSLVGTFDYASDLDDVVFGRGTNTLIVGNLTPEEETEVLSDEIHTLIADASIPADAGEGLLDKLEEIRDKIEAGMIQPALNQLDAFIHQVEGLIEDGSVTPEIGQALVDAARDIQDGLEDEA